MKKLLNKDFWYSYKGMIIIICIIFLIIVPTIENYSSLQFSSVLGVVVADGWLISKAIFYDHDDKKKIVLDILLSIVVVAVCLYIL